MPAHTNRYTITGHAAIVALAVLALIYIDHETRDLADVFRLQHLPAFVVYFLPAWLFTLSLHAIFKKVMQRDNSFVTAMVVGIPAAFTLTIIFLK